MEHDLINLQQDTHELFGPGDEATEVRRASSTDEPMFNDQFEAYQKQQDQLSGEDVSGDLAPLRRPSTLEERSRLTPERSLQHQSQGSRSSNRYKREQKNMTSKGADHTPMPSLAK